MTAISRREFLKVSATSASAAMLPVFAGSACAAASEPAKKRWYKGDLHQHCLWSDGYYFPEWMADWYKSHGYHFICPSDHNIFQSIYQQIFQHYTKKLNSLISSHMMVN